MRRTLIAALLAGCALLGGCSAAVGGSGHVGLPANAPTLPGQPNVPNQPNQPAPTVDCPRVSDPQAGLTYRCVTSGIAQSSDLLWTVNLGKQTEPGWLLGEGSTSAPLSAAVPLEQVTNLVRREMVQLNYWGPNPGVRTLSSAATKVSGADAWVLATSFTINPKYRSQQHLKVRTEHTWIVAIRASNTAVALWYVTLPDEVQRLWHTVPALIRGIRLR
ncbi:MAG TPA: hypothetical protein VFE40_00460 [Jatrophihabitantaceae bacterium]|jgi:hypothetical protein|nr:hypothetical protein [Jatrophihabitantaceae bacterium]